VEFFLFFLRYGLGGIKINNNYIAIASATIYIKNRYLNNPRLALLGQVYYNINTALIVNISIVIVLTIYIL